MPSENGAGRGPLHPARMFEAAASVIRRWRQQRSVAPGRVRWTWAGASQRTRGSYVDCGCAPKGASTHDAGRQEAGPRPTDRGSNPRRSEEILMNGLMLRDRLEDDPDSGSTVCRPPKRTARGQSELVPGTKTNRPKSTSLQGSPMFADRAACPEGQEAAESRPGEAFRLPPANQRGPSTLLRANPRRGVWTPGMPATERTRTSEEVRPERRPDVGDPVAEATRSDSDPDAQKAGTPYFAVPPSPSRRRTCAAIRSSLPLRRAACFVYACSTTPVSPG